MAIFPRAQRLAGGVVVLVVDQLALERPAGRVGMEYPILAVGGAGVLFEMAGAALCVEAGHPQRAVQAALALLEDADLVADAPLDLGLHRPGARGKLDGRIGAPALDARQL